MSRMNLTIGHEAMASERSTGDVGPVRTMAELSILLSNVYTARGRLHFHLGEADLAMTDLDQALRHDADNGEALALRAGIRGEVAILSGPVPVAGWPSDHAGDHSDVGGSHLQAGYYLMTTRDSGNLEHLLHAYPLTLEGRAAAIEYSDELARDPSKRWELDSYYAVDDPDFDAVVYEVRSIARRVHHASALDKHGKPIEW